MLAYGSLLGGDDLAVKVGEEIAAAARDAGLQVEWDGTVDARIALTPLKWRRRRPDEQRPS